MDGDLVRAAHADAWEAHGRFRRRFGGDAGRLPGARLMTAGLPYVQWSSGDVMDASAVDIDAVRAWYRDRPLPTGASAPWGLRVPRAVAWPYGRHVLALRLMGLRPEAYVAAPSPAGVRLRPAGPGDVDAVLAIDTVAFEATDETQRPWVLRLLEQPGVTVCVAESAGEVVAAGLGLRTDGDAGPALYLAGIGVAPGARRRGIGAALSSWLIEHGLREGAGLAHLHPDTDEAARIYARLGFVETAGLDVYVDC